MAGRSQYKSHHWEGFNRTYKLFKFHCEHPESGIIPFSLQYQMCKIQHHIPFTNAPVVAYGT